MNKNYQVNIASIYSLATAEDREIGMYWYQSAKEHAARLGMRYNLSVEKCAGVIAVLSPGAEWGKNLLDADTLISQYVHGYRGEKLPTVGTYGRKNIEKSERILNGERFDSVVSSITSPKVYNFYHAIIDPQDGNAIVIDRHAKCIATLATENRDKTGIVTPKEYKVLAAAYKEVAENLELIPSQLQAVTWVTWKRLMATYEIPETNDASGTSNEV